MRRGGAGAGDLSFSKGGLIPGLWVHGRLPVDVKEGTPPGRQHACLQVGVLGVPGTAGDGLARGAQRQVRSASPGFLSPKCELIIQMGCPGSGDWRPAPAHRAISPAAHVIAALVRCAVHTSSSSSPSSRSPPPAPTPLASRRLPAARHCQPQPAPAAPGARRQSARPTASLGFRPPGFFGPPPPPATFPPTPSYFPRQAAGEREEVESREGERGSAREGGREGTVPLLTFFF